MGTPASGPAANRLAGHHPIFDHMLVGIDETPESLVATAQARVLRAPDGHLAQLAVAETYLAAQAEMAAPIADDDLSAGTSTALDRAQELVEAVGSASSTSGLVVVGRGRTHGHRWGGVVERVVYSARCSVPVVRHEDV